jgi:hypothetical protein
VSDRGLDGRSFLVGGAAAPADCSQRRGGLRGLAPQPAACTPTSSLHRCPHPADPVPRPAQPRPSSKRYEFCRTTSRAGALTAGTACAASDQRPEGLTI